MRIVDILIIGGGPAGLTAAQYGARAALKTLLVEQAAFGGQALLIDALENYPGNTARKTGVEVTGDFEKQALDFGAALETGEVVSLKKTGAAFEARLEDGGVIGAKAVILCTGAGHRLLDVPGEAKFAGRGVSYCASCDGPFFKQKKIFVAGGGDAACDEAYFLARFSSDITLLVRRGEFRAQKAVARRALDHPSIKVAFYTKIVEVRGTEKLGALVLEDTRTGERRETGADALFVCTGIVPRTELVTGAEIQAELDRAGFITTAQNMESSVSGLFVAGDVRSSPFRQVVVACGEGAIAAHAAAAYIAARSA